MLKQLNEVRNLKDPLKQFVSTWQFSFDASSPLNQIVDTKDLELRCQTYGLPTLTGDDTTVTWGGFKRVYAGKQTRQGSWSVNFVEVWDASVMEMFKQWFNMYHQYKEGKITLLNTYAANCNISIVNPDVYDEDQVKNKYDLRLYDVFPTQLNMSQIEASSSDPVTIDVELNFNYFLMGDEVEG